MEAWLAGSFAAWIALAASPMPPTVADVTVEIDGTVVAFDRAPVRRDGRVFVPVRGVFERLGATVAAAGPRVTARAGARTIEMSVGTTIATVDRTAVALDDPPFLLDGRVLVPLRFVATALGATVAYDDRRRVATIARGTAPGLVSLAPGAPAAPVARAVAAAPIASVAPVAPVAPGTTTTTATTTAEGVTDVAAANAAAPARASRSLPAGTTFAMRLLRLEPADGNVVARARPEISATFSEEIVPASAHVALDGRDVTGDAYRSARAFAYEPAADLAPGDHTVAVTGRTPERESFAATWTFATREAAGTNYLSGLEPVDGVAVTSRVDVSGYTRPRSRVRVVATTSGTVPVFNDAADSGVTVDAVANAKGFFSAELDLVDRGSGLADVRLVATAPDGAIAVRTLRLRF